MIETRNTVDIAVAMKRNIVELQENEEAKNLIDATTKLEATEDGII